MGDALNRAIIARACAGIVDDGVAVIESAASNALVTALAREARRRDTAGEFHPAGVGRESVRVERPDIRGDRTCWLEERTLCCPERMLWDALDALRTALNREAWLGLLSLEAHYAIYPRGGFYRRHRDRFRDDDTRVLSWILYLNAGWTVADGGALRLHLADATTRDVLPAGGTLVCLLADRIEHEVLPPARERLSIAGWFRRRERSP